MACGVPVVASAVGGLAETVLDGTTGVLVPPRRPDAIAAALRRVIGQHDAAASMSARAVERAGGYGWDRIARRTADVLAAMALRGRRGDTTPAPLGRPAARVGGGR